jgi:hypothetical protein
MEHARTVAVASGSLLAILVLYFHTTRTIPTRTRPEQAPKSGYGIVPVCEHQHVPRQNGIEYANLVKPYLIAAHTLAASSSCTDSALIPILPGRLKNRSRNNAMIARMIAMRIGSPISCRQTSPSTNITIFDSTTIITTRTGRGTHCTLDFHILGMSCWKDSG